MPFKFIPAQNADKTQLADLRVKAMQPSLEILGRFDPIRVRNRLLNDFDAANTQKIIIDNQLAGFFTTSLKDGDLWLKHLYIAPNGQGHGLGKAVVNHVKSLAIKQNIPLKLQALKQSPANQFYQKHGFVETHQEQWDIFYVWHKKAEA